MENTRRGGKRTGRGTATAACSPVDACFMDLFSLLFHSSLGLIQLG